jgi:hypothetical protein
MRRFRFSLSGAAVAFLVGYACGGGGGAVARAAQTLFEFGGASLARQLEEAGPPPITSPFGIAENVPEDGSRHFTLTVATENRTATSDAAALYAQMDGHGPIGQVWGANLLAFAHGDMTSGGVQGLEVDVGNLGTPADVGVAGINVFAIGAKRSDVALGVLNGVAAGDGGFREGIAFHSNAPGVAVSEALMRVHPGFGSVDTGIDLRAATFSGPAIATPGFSIDARGAIASEPLATGRVAYACVDPDGRIFASPSPCVGP